MTRRAVSPSDLFRRMNGLICIYKPSGYLVNRCLQILRHKLVTDLNTVAEQLQRLPSGTVQLPSGLPAPIGSLSSALTSDDRQPAVSTLWQPPAADELPARLVTGPAFLPADIRLLSMYSLGRHSSGPVVVGINSGVRLLETLRQAGPQLRVYHITVQMGLATETMWSGGRVTDRATHGHVTRGKLESLLCTLQAAHQKHMFESSGLPPNSQAAYELAVRGPPRPQPGSPPVLYAIRCVQFSPPFFTLEIHSINETERYLLTLANDLGRQLRSAATAVRLRCLRVGPFTADDALLLKHWRLAWLGPSMRTCGRATEQLAAADTLRPLQDPAHGQQTLAKPGVVVRSETAAEAAGDSSVLQTQADRTQTARV